MTDKQRRWFRYFVDYAALIAFFIAYFTTRDLLKATYAVVAGSVVAVIASLVVERRIAPLPLFVGLAGIIFGGLTLIFHDTRIIKMKPTFINVALGGVLLIGVAMRKNPLKYVLGGAIQLPDDVWRRMTINFGLFYLALAAANEVVWRTQPENIWVLFRFPGPQILTFAFFFTQLPMILKHAKAEDVPPPPTE